MSKPSPALLIACLALFVALGGSAVAAKLSSGGAHAIVARVRSVGSIVEATETTTPDQVTGGTWKQGAEELDQLVGQINVSSPVGVFCETEHGSNQINILVNGDSVDTIPLNKSGENGVLAIDIPIMEPGTATSRTLTVQMEDSCDAGTDSSLISVALDVVGVH